MKKHISQIAVGAAIFALAGSVSATTDVAAASGNNTVQGRSIGECIGAIQDHHPKAARLFLDHRARADVVNGEKVYSISGWVWRDGERVRVSHQCRQYGADSLALNVIYADGVELAKK